MGEKTKKVIWRDDVKDIDYVFDEEDIREVIYVGDSAFECDGDGIDLDSVDVHELTKVLEDFEDQHDDFDRYCSEDIEDFFRYLGYEVTVSMSPPYREINNKKLIYDPMSGFYISTKDGYIMSIYEYWDGRGWKVIELREDMIETQVTIDSDFVDLDEWDGRNWYTKYRFHHEKIYKIIEIDGEPAEDDYLLVSSSQYQGELPTGKILTLEGVKKHLQELGRDVERYLKLLFEIGK